MLALTTRAAFWKAPAGTEADLRALRVLNSACQTLKRILIEGDHHAADLPERNRELGRPHKLRRRHHASRLQYIPIRPRARFIEESLYRGLKWVIFEPNAERAVCPDSSHVGAFRTNLSSQGAFQGQKPRDASSSNATRKLPRKTIEPGHRQHLGWVCTTEAGRIRDPVPATMAGQIET